MRISDQPDLVVQAKERKKIARETLLEERKVRKQAKLDIETIKVKSIAICYLITSLQCFSLFFFQLELIILIWHRQA